MSVICKPIVVILFGAGLTRYFGFEGMMHIREGSTTNTFLSSNTHLLFNVEHQGATYSFDEKVLFATLGNNNLKKSYVLGNKKVEVEVLEFIPNPTEVMLEDEAGIPILKVVIGGANGREEYYLRYGTRSRIKGTLFNFGRNEEPGAFNIKYEKGSLSFLADMKYSQMIMANQQKDTLPPGQYHPLRLRSLYSNGLQSFVFGDFLAKGSVEISISDRKMASNSVGGLRMRISDGENSVDNFVFGTKGVEGRSRVFQVGAMNITVSYGSKRYELPFGLELREFILEKYPGTNNASSYASEVTLKDPRKNISEESRIYMNHILNHGGYRFFQSSFDKDELGTYLSVNHDWWGTWVSYLGYALLTIGMLLTFFSKKSRFRILAKKLNETHEKKHLTVLLVGFLLIGSMTSSFATSNSDLPSGVAVVDAEHAKNFGRLIITQDHRGRNKPMNTYANEIVRKLSKKGSLYGLIGEQIVLSMAASPNDWYQVPLIKMGSHQDTKRLIQADGELAAYADFFEKNGKYKLREYIIEAHNTPNKDRGVFEKEMLKLDEKINICRMVFEGRFMKAFPTVNNEGNSWESPVGFGHQHNNAENTFAAKFYEAYVSSLQIGLQNGNWKLSNEMVAELGKYQLANGEGVPSNAKRNAELLLNRLSVFGRLAKNYGFLGLFLLGLLFLSVFKPNMNLRLVSRIAVSLFILFFFFHMLGLGLRWYVSGRAPWSNGYESMIYIAFTASLAGIIFGRKSLGGLAATCILSATILMVAGLSWLDPEITPLVPVLKSYWLTIHVSLVAGSYGFLMLGALIGAFNLIFIIFRTQQNSINVNRIIKELGQISEMTLIGGLFMISIGTYLGGVWANESWGRYWGWDAKETWALVTILVYAFILHMRFIPGLKGPLAFNIASLFGWASVIMTYFGVNYYLSGLHSYASGDPIPIPSTIYYAIIVLAGISVLAAWRNYAYKRARNRR